MIDTTISKASIDQSVNLPDYFSCQNCIAWKGKHVNIPTHEFADRNGWVDMCYILREQNRCAKDALVSAINSGAIQITLYLPGAK